MPRWHASCVLRLSSTLAALLAATACSAQSRHGQPITAERTDGNPTYGVLANAPRSRIVQPGVLELQFTTLGQTPPAVVHFGINSLDEELDYPRFRDSAGESANQMSKEHLVRYDFRALLAKMPNTPFEPRICWRAEVYVPGLRSVRFVEGRAYFDPKTLGDTVNVTVGPMVCNVAPDSAVIVFETDRDAKGSVTMGERRFGDDTARRRHEIRVDGLAPGSTCTYRVQAGDTLVRPYSFVTAPKPGADQVRFVTLVDSREGYGGGLRNAHGVDGFALRALTAHAYHRRADFILAAGDLINGYTGSSEEFRMELDGFRRAVAPVAARIPVYTSMGNHEALFDLVRAPTGAAVRVDQDGDQSAEAVFGAFFCNPENGLADEGPGTPTYRENVYVIDRGCVRLIVLNNNYWWSADPWTMGGNLEGFVMARQMAWLREQIAAADKEPAVRHVFVAAQEPPFPNGGHAADAMWWNGGDTNLDKKVGSGDIDIVGNRNELWEIIAGSAKTVAFICGDEHAYARMLVTKDTPIGPRHKPGGGQVEFKHPVWQVTSGGAGAPWYDKQLDLPWSAALAAHSTLPHYAMFEVDGAAVDLLVFSENGQLLDRAKLR